MLRRRPPAPASPRILVGPRRRALRAAILLGMTGAGLAGSPASGVAQTGVPRTSAPSPNADVFLVPLTGGGGTLSVGAPRNVTSREGYDNQPSFSPDSRVLYFTSNRGDGHTDIWRHDLASGRTGVALATKPESEYSAFATADGRGLTVIRVEADSTQRLWQLPLDGRAGAPLFPGIKPVGYFAQADSTTWALFVLGSPATLQIARTGRATGDTVAREIGRSLHRIPGSSRVSYVQKGPNGWHVMSLDPATGRADTLVRTPDRSEDVAWVDGETLIVGQGSRLLMWRRGAASWTPLADFGAQGMRGITRLAVSPDRRWIALVADVP